MIHEIFTEYKEYNKKAEKLKHGKTAQRWFGYITMVQLYHEFIRSIRTGGLELYIFCLERSSDCFFTFKHPSYARWLVRYHDNYLKLKNTSPDTRRIFERLFLAKKNNKIFLRITNRPERSASNKY